MNTLKLKAFVASNKVMNAVADRILNQYVMLRRRFTGSYTKGKEDVIAWKLLKEFTGKKMSEIKYLDVGANHYKRGNNSYLFYESGARGILVEADPLLCEKLRRYRKEDAVCNVAMSGQGGGEKVPFYIMSMPTRSSMDKRHIEHSVKEGLYIKEIIHIPCKTINDLLEEYQFEPDYLSIDIEGMDYEVLRGLDYSKYNIQVIVAEKTNEKSQDGETMDEFMESKGYKVYKDCGSNVVYGIKDYEDRMR